MSFNTLGSLLMVLLAVCKSSAEVGLRLVVEEIVLL